MAHIHFACSPEYGDEIVVMSLPILDASIAVSEVWGKNITGPMALPGEIFGSQIVRFQ
jgi:hypothetical protein